MRTALGLLIFIFAQPSFARVEFTPVKQILIQGESCEELEFHAQSIAVWTESVTNKKSEVPECFCSSKSCQMDVSSVSLFKVKELANFGSGFEKSSANNGPNCFNSALYFSETLANITFTHPAEMSAVLASSLCRERPFAEELQPGDLMAVRDQTDELFEIHAGVYINEQLSFSKYGQSSMMPYTYGIDADKSYGVKDEACRRVYGTPRQGDECYKKPYVNYYSCGSIYSFISKIMREPGGINEGARELYAKTSRFDSKISSIAYKGGRIDSQALAALQVEVRALYDQSEDILRQGSLNSINRELASLMRYRLYSLYGQLRIIAKDRGEADPAPAPLRSPKV